MNDDGEGILNTFHYYTNSWNTPYVEMAASVIKYQKTMAGFIGNIGSSTFSNGVPDAADAAYLLHCKVILHWMDYAYADDIDL
jgi:hypothetical protein